jgi:uncharacterized membrane protein (DUF106 family)
LKNKIIGTFVFLLLFVAMGSAHSKDFELELLVSDVEEGQQIVFNLTPLNPSLRNVQVGATLIGPDGEVEFVLPAPDRRMWPAPSFPPGTGRVNGTEVAEMDDISGETKFEWRTPFNGRIQKNILDKEEEGNWTLRVVVKGVDFENDQSVQQTLEANFTITRLLSVRNPKYIIFAISAVTSLFTTVATFAMVDQKRAKMIREKVKTMQKEVMTAQRSGDKKKITKAKKKQSEMMALQSEMFRSQLKPMIIYMIPLFAVFYFLRSQFDMIPVAELPFRLGFMQFFHQNNGISVNQFGFIAWYFASATWFGSIFRKILGVA